MKYRTDDAPAADQAAVPCCGHGELVKHMDEILLAGMDGRVIPTGAVDQLPPWRARLVAGVAVRAGGQLEHGTMDRLVAAARKAGGAAEPGWWRAALGLEPPEVYVPPRSSSSVPPGWTVKPTN